LDRQLKKTGQWKHDISKNSCLNWNSTLNDTNPEINLNLFNEFQIAINDSILHYHLERNGRNYPEFKMMIQRLTFDPNSGIPKMNETIGTWKAGLGGTELIEFVDGKKDLNEHKVRLVFRVVVVVVCTYNIL
jgi:hypothetical protein